MTTERTKPLEDIIVLDLSRILAGPWASQGLADMGAQVIKVERPETGDDTRSWGPPFIGEQAAYYLSANRGKRSVTIDITRPEGQILVKALAAKADILIENFKVDGLAKYGLDYQSLKKTNPKLVYCSITGFGQTGPLRDKLGYDAMIQGLGGLMSITGVTDEAGGEPTKVGVAVADIFSGLYATIGILAALRQAEATGQGTQIDLSLLDVQMAVLGNQALNYFATGDAPKRKGNAHPNIVPYQSFATKDGHMILAVGNDTQFADFAEVIDLPELAEDVRFVTNQKRVENRELLVPLLANILKTDTSIAWIAKCEAANVPCGAINTIEQAFDLDQAKARNTKLELSHPSDGPVPSVASPIRFGDQQMTSDIAPPTLGQDSDIVLKNYLNLSDEEIAALRDKAVI